MKNNNWFKLDTVAKVYPSSSNGRIFEVNVISVILKHEVDGVILEEAVNSVLNRFPSFKVKLRRGLFWYYLDYNPKKFVVQKEDGVCNAIRVGTNNDYLFKITYVQKKISIGIFHALTDGSGALEFLKSVVFSYLQKKGFLVTSDEKVFTLDTPPTEEEMRNDYYTYFDKDVPVVKNPEKKAFFVDGTPILNSPNVTLIGRLETQQLLELCHQYGVSLTCFVVSLLFFSIYKTQMLGKTVKTKLLKAFVPVNLRKIFPSKTLKNFIGYFRVSHDFANPLEFEELLQLVQKQIKEKTTKENLLSNFCKNVKMERNFALRITPLFVKDVAMNIGYKLGDGLHTFSFSNLGNVVLPPSMEKEVDSMIMFASAKKRRKFNCNMISCAGVSNICFSRSFVERDIEHFFFTFLSQKGIRVQLISNEREGGNEAL